ncbi:MAG TPA: ABC transporter permease [Clostridiales bacterium]|jgi:cell division transport system permease protein|nr:ABC transporter permease [Clostridiales bacterium]
MIRSLRYSLTQATVQVFRNKGMSLASIFSITAMLLILGLFFFISVNINIATEKAKQQFNTIEVYLLEETTRQDADVIAQSLLSMDEISGVVYVSKEDAMQAFKQRWGEKSYLLDGLADNPLPNALRVELADLEDGRLVYEACRNLIGVEDVRFYQEEVSKILTITDFIQKGALIVIVFLIIVSVIVVSNTVKLTVMARQREIMIMKYVGATNWFIRGPLLAEGMMIGCISAFIALGLTWLIYARIVNLFATQALLLFSSSFVEVGFMMKNLSWIFIALGASIGAFGSILSMRRFLNA